MVRRDVLCGVGFSCRVCFVALRCVALRCPCGPFFGAENNDNLHDKDGNHYDKEKDGNTHTHTHTHTRDAVSVIVAFSCLIASSDTAPHSDTIRYGAGIDLSTTEQQEQQQQQQQQEEEEEEEGATHLNLKRREFQPWYVYGNPRARQVSKRNGRERETDFVCVFLHP